MAGQESDVASAASLFHEDIPHRFQVSLTMSMQTRDELRAVRDAVTEADDDQAFTTDDVVRFALRSAARYHAFATGELSEPTDLDDDQYLPLAAAIRDTLDEVDGDDAAADRSVE